MTAGALPTEELELGSISIMTVKCTKSFNVAQEQVSAHGQF
jgi:hypothetical protein